MISSTEKRVFESLAIPLALSDEHDGVLRIETVTDGLCDLVRAKREDLIASCNNSFYGNVHTDDVHWVHEAILRFKREHSHLDVIIRYKRRLRDDYMLLHVIAKWQRMEDGSEMVLFAFDDMRNTESSFNGIFNSYDNVLKEMIYTDSTTGLPNLIFVRQIADDKVHKLMACGDKAALIYVNVNAMHSYNTRFGYEKGDELMRLIAGVLQELFPEALVGRGADDHFVIIDAFLGKEDLTAKVDSANRKIKKKAFGKAEGIRVGAYVIEPEVSPAQAFDFARQALKDIGNNLNVNVNVYSHERNDVFWRERYIIENFENAMINKWIKVFYQPILRAESQSIYALEALARWIDPVRSLISPGEFIPLLQRYHLMHKLDIYMAEQVCREFEVRRKAGLPIVPVSINFSAQDFDYIDVPEKLGSIVKKYKLKPEDLIIEITEQDVAQGAEQFKEQLNVLRKNGHKLWVDDFGSGYSSLNVFSQYTMDLVKLDMEMIRHLDDNNGANRHIMRALVGMCHGLGIGTLAEGVENEEHFRFLEEIGCEFIQGFYFFKPQSIEESIYRFKKMGPVLAVEAKEEE